MCRLLIFKGEPIVLAHLITKPSHSIINQAFDSRLRLDARPINADGFGVGWYDESGEDSTPCVFQAITPAWSNKNLQRLAEKIRSPLVFAHVRASTSGALSEENCHPWIYGSLLWMHNGQIAGFDLIKRKLQAGLSDEFFNYPQGCTDSEWAFALFLNELSKVSQPDSSSFPYTTLKETMFKTIQIIKELHKESNVKELTMLNFAVTDGKSVVATRYVTSSTDEAASLYFSTGSSFESKVDDQTTNPSINGSSRPNHSHDSKSLQYRMKKCDKREKVVLIASEPLTFEKTDWLEIPCQTLIVVTPKMNVLQFPIVDEFYQNTLKANRSSSYAINKGLHYLPVEKKF
ncbi:nucleophile aminohydrolase [Phakopsora pachyrhizi]|uniref:Nucleophile aminohydrolase n=1 Tax=Phakopsora pachyrhizi TaxID=170000 RepID=A0AAV0B5Y2_PHAPC|nr:nucleophile aminohydrolase [Phakopsora pachyrhizi]